jgi:D-lactate dehydrogenase
MYTLILLELISMKAAFFEVQDWERGYLLDGLSDFEVELFQEPLEEKTIGAAVNADVVSVFIYSKLDSTLISKLKKTKLIATRSTGFDHIDNKAANMRSITVCNVPHYGEVTVAEHTFALILSLSRWIHDSYERTRQGDFTCQSVQGFDLKDKILGVLGTGRIGTNVIEIAKGFKMNVLAYDKFPKPTLAKSMDFQYVSWQELLQKSDIVTLHLPLTDETAQFLNKNTISMMKKGAVVINTARGGLIDTRALTNALSEGHLRAAGLDVLEEETLIREEAQLLLDNLPREKLATMLREQILLRLKNVIITPHCAFNSKESLERLINTTIENIKAFAAGHPQNAVI